MPILSIFFGIVIRINFRDPTRLTSMRIMAVEKRRLTFERAR